MIIDARTYTLLPRKLATYLAAFEADGLPAMERHGLELVGYHTSVIGQQNQVTHIWRYASLADMEAKRAARDADPQWADFQAKTEGLALLQENRVLKPVPFSPDFE
ncbi:MAG: NIPSNAP family protein [Pseudomonadota bacterium]